MATKAKATTSDARTSKWTVMHTRALLACLAGIFLVGLVVPAPYRLWSWLLTMALLALFGIIAGHGITGEWHGLLIDERNKLSLSRLQMVLWTILVLSAILAVALSNLRLGESNPLAVALPTELWILMGISTTSLVASPLVLSTKKHRAADDYQTAQTFDTIVTNQGVSANLLDTQGQVVVNTDASNARWSDMFRGEEVGNGGQLDLGKIQMFYFTLILVLAYGAALASLFMGSKGPISAFPGLDASMIALLGISQAGYLSNKAIGHS